jgi:hypothetical protein
LQKQGLKFDELIGTTKLDVGLGGMGFEIARRPPHSACAFMVADPQVR